MFRLILNEKELELLGTGSLTGMVLTANGNKLPEQVELVFPLSTFSRCEKHGGPRHFIISEWSFPGFLDCVLRMQEQGIKISMKMENTVEA